MTGSELDFECLWGEGIPYTRFLEEAEENRSLWEGVYRLAQIPEWALDEACEKGIGRRFLVIAEDWCGDASSTVPILAKLGDEADCLNVRLLKRDERPEIMDRYLTNGSRSIPIVIVLDCDFKELGHWGPRPTELQDWVMAHKDTMPKDERYKHVRRWYAKDKGKTTLKEVLVIL